MHAKRRADAGWQGVAWLLLVAGLVLALMVPTAAGAQFKGDRPEDDDPVTEEADLPAGEDDEEADEAADPEDLGLVGRRSYESPQFGYTVDWSREWDVDEFYEEPLISDEDAEQDRIYLLWQGDAPEEAFLVITGQAASRGGVDEDVDEWLDPDFIENQWDETLEVEPILDDASRDTGAVLYSLVDTENDDAQYFVMYVAVELEDGTMIYITFTAFGEHFEAAYEAAGDVLVNDEPVLQFLEWDDIEDAIADL